MKYLAIVHENGSESRVFWCNSKKAADERLAQWMRENPNGEFHRMTIAECLWTIEN